MFLLRISHHKSYRNANSVRIVIRIIKLSDYFMYFLHNFDFFMYCNSDLLRMYVLLTSTAILMEVKFYCHSCFE